VSNSLSEVVLNHPGVSSLLQGYVLEYARDAESHVGRQSTSPFYTPAPRLHDDFGRR
jgi:hypothetical protein